MPKKGRLTDVHLEQVRSMRRDGKTYEEIKTFFKDTYNINLWDAEIARICKGVKAPKGFKRRGARGSYKKSEAHKAVYEPTKACLHKEICRFAAVCEPAICKFIRR